MEERNDIIGYASYEQYKTELKTELQKEAEGFVRIGYLLKVARDTSILKDSGYSSVNEFAAAEFDLDASQVSRFMNINDRFSEGGYSERLEERFRGIGYAKLSLMLTLPDVINAEITENYSKSEIQAIKDEVEAEKKVSDLEVMLEGEQPKQKEMSTMLQKAIHQLGYEQPELYVKVHNLFYGNIGWYAGDGREKRLHETLAPTGEGMYSIRLQGIGRQLLTIKEPGGTVTLTNIRSGEKEEYSWDELELAWDLMLDAGDGKQNWSQMYAEEYPEKKEEIAPVQANNTPVKKEEAPAKRKPSKVTKANVEKKKPAAVVSNNEETQKDESATDIEMENVESATLLDENETSVGEMETLEDTNEPVLEENIPHSEETEAMDEELNIMESTVEEVRSDAEAMASRILSALVRWKWKVPDEEEYLKVYEESKKMTALLARVGGRNNE